MRLSIPRLISALTASVLLAGSAAAQTADDRPLKPEETNDLMCVAVYSLVAAQDGMAEAGAIGMLYFFGRLEGRDPQTDWLERFGKFAQDLSGDQIQTHGLRCGQILVDKGQALSELGARMTATEPTS